MEFFTKEELEMLKKWAKVDYDKENDEHKRTFQELKFLYEKVKHWAKEAKKMCFPEGAEKTRRNPLNQSQKFEAYQWARIYPTKTDLGKKYLAFTLGINSAGWFDIKIDTIGLSDNDEVRKKYFDFRGDYGDSQIVIMFSFDEILNWGWEKLLNETRIALEKIEPYYSDLKMHLGEPDHIEFLEHNSTNLPISLNTILFGPPGTGKTYMTKSLAVEIVDGHVSLSREEVNDRYSKLVDENLIKFVTFHQSMTYEDFVEGIKPSKPRVGDEYLKYEIEAGIFKRICEKAASNYENSKIDNKNKLPFEEAFERFKEEWEENPEMKFPLKTKGYDFTVIGFTSTSIQFKKASGGTSHTLSINTLKEQYYGKEFNFNQGVGIYYPAILNKINTYSPSNPQKIKITKFALIIDEINRGNISQIFGELITLIEEDKRLGNKEHLEVTLPYSKETFSVPPNLYIIGTMNTADRSVEALDTALRRRFNFEEVSPNPSLLSSDKEESLGINLEQLLIAINFRLRKLLNKDYQIGHAFFINVFESENPLLELRMIFNNKILPLLQEYFYGNFGKMQLVLGSSFVRAEEDNGFKFAEDGGEEYMEKTVYQIVDVSDQISISNEEFKTALIKIYNPDYGKETTS